MSPDRAEAAARLLADTRGASRVLSGLPEPLTPRDLDEAYRIQDAFVRLWPDRVVGWKAGATSRIVQERLAIPEPIAGPFFSADTFASPAELPAARFPHLCLESEFAFRFARDLPATGMPRGREEVLSAVDALVPAIEIVGPRFDSLLAGRGPTATADCALDAGFVLGGAVADWRNIDLASHPVTLIVDGAVRAQGTGAAVLGHPIAALMWTVEHLHRRRIDIAAGQVISTGTTTGLVYVEPEQSAVADFGVLGHVALRFTGPAHPQAVTGH